MVGGHLDRGMTQACLNDLDRQLEATVDAAMHHDA
jgi:hypothetical protein